MGRKLFIFSAFFFALSTSNQALGQTPGGLMNMFTAIMGAAIVNNARIEWSKIRSDETACIEQELRERGASIGTLIQNGIVPNDPRVAGIRYDCRTAALNPPYIAPNANSGNNRRDQNSQQSQSSSPSSSPYVIDGLALGEKVAFNSGAYNKYHCCPSDKFPGFTWCHKDETKRDRRLEITLSNSILHAQDGTAWYINRFIEPATFGKNEVRGEINRLSAKYGQSPAREIRMPHKDGLPDAIMVVWGEVELEQLSDEEVRTIANGGRHEGILVAFLGDLEKSAKRGTPLYRLSGGAGYVWIATYNNAGRGVLRFLTVDASQISQPNGIATTKGSQSAQAPTQPAPPPPKPAPPRIETPRLKEARIFLDDTKKFLSQQKSVPAISDLAKEAATLQLALNQFDEHGAVDSMQRLNELLKPIPGFTEFEKQQQAERDREKARHLAETRTQAKENQFFIDAYLRVHLGEPKTPAFLSLQGQTENALKSNRIDEITKANDAVALYIKNNDLTEEYAALTKTFGQPEPSPPKPLPQLKDILPPETRFLIEGPADEIILLYNASPTSPKVWKNVRGDVVFQHDAATLCFAQSEVELAVARYVDHYLGDRGARNTTSVSPPCDISNAEKTIDVIVFQRGNLLKSREDYVLALARLLQADTFRRYETISDYDSVVQKRQTLSLQIEADLDESSRQGFGVISVTDMQVACVIPPSKAAWSDGLKELLKRNLDIIAPTLPTDWQYVETPTTDLAFLGLQRHQCGYVLGTDNDLKEIMLALRREKLKYAFAPVWWDGTEVDRATFDVHDAAQQEMLKLQDLERKRKAEADLLAARERNKQNEKYEIERKLREANGTKARGLLNNIHDLVSGMAEKRSMEDADLFPTYAKWLNQRFDDQWETFNVNSDVADFGTAQWENRPLDAVIVKTIVHQKNCVLGKYEDKCYLFGFVADEEFSMLRDSFAVDCSDAPDLNKWKVGERFQSRWNAD